LRKNDSFKEQWLDEELRKSLEKYHTIFRSGDEVKVEVLKEYEGLILTALQKVID
jgi:hypothetical protein